MKVSTKLFSNQFLFWFIAFIIVIIDQLTKYFVRTNISFGESVPITRFLSFSHISNTGVAFGFFQGANWLFLGITVIIVIGVLYYHKEIVSSIILAISFGLILGGGIGNVIDRILFGAVTDFIHLGFWPAFNIADTAITISIALLLWSELRSKE